MHIYGTPFSPFVQRVLITARLKGHELELRPPPGGSMRAPEFLAISPLGRVPLLEDDGWRLCESGAIVRYLDETLAGPPLMPDTARARAAVAEIESLAISELPGLRPVINGEVFRRDQPPALAAAGRAQAAAGLAAIERVRDRAHRWAAGNQPSHADTLLVPLLALMELVDPVAPGLIALIRAQPGITDYFDRARLDPAFAPSLRAMAETAIPVLAHSRAKANA